MKNVCFRLKPRQHFEDGEFFNNFPNDVCNFSVGKVLPKWNFSRDVKPIEKILYPGSFAQILEAKTSLMLRTCIIKNEMKNKGFQSSAHNFWRRNICRSAFLTEWKRRISQHSVKHFHLIYSSFPDISTLMCARLGDTCFALNLHRLQTFSW